MVVDDFGEVVERYALDGLVRHIEDIEVTATHLYVYETGLAQPTVARVGRSDLSGGTGVGSEGAWESFALPGDLGDLASVTGLRKDADGTVHLEFSLGARVRPLFAANGSFLAEGQAAITGSHRVGDHEIELIGVDLSAGENGEAVDLSSGALLVDGVEVHSFKTAGMLAGLGFIAAGQDGEFWIRVQDVNLVDGAISVRDLAYRFTLAGEVLEIVEMPVAGEAVYVHHRVAFDLDGNVRALRTTREEVVLVEPAPINVAVVGQLPPGAEPLSFSSDSAAAIEKAWEIGMSDPQADQCVTGSEIMNRAWSYANYQAVYGSSHLDNTCAHRSKPDFLKGVPVTGVAYRFGGYQSLSTYDSAVAQGKVIGDISSEGCKSANCNYGVAACANGVDCSGFVSQSWAASYHTTHYMHQISNEISPAQLIAGDAVNKAGSHVRLVEKNLGNSVIVVESTTGGFNRVIR
ncbi:MAG: hypothetical protein KC457_14655, partial [Myxococcales bacterium]|nr:hypothetical protein [Myxococcales bacterium]